MTVFSSPTTNPIIPSTNNYILIRLNAENNNITLTYPQSFVPRKDYMAPFIEVTLAASFTGGVIKFDDTALTSFGNGCIISNIGAQNFMLNDFNNNPILDVESGKQYVLFIGKDVESGNPVWRHYQLGTGTSEADANALAGFGLSVFNNKLNSTVPTQNKNTSVTIDNNVTSNLINWTGGTDDIDLVPSAITIEGFYFYFRNSSTTDGVITFHALEGSTIDGASTLLMNVGQSSIIIFDAATTSWKTVGLGLFGSSSGGRITQTGIKVINGTALAPSYSFIEYPNLGFYASGSSEVSFTSAGFKQLSFNNDGINLDSLNKFKMNDDDILFLARIYP